MIPKGKVLALLLAFTAVGGLAATGAFTTVQAERTADVSVSGDDGALLSITPNPDPGNSDFITQSGTGSETFEIVLDDALNARASTSAEDLFTITNNGEQAVDVWIATEGGVQSSNDSINTTFYIDDSKIVSDATANDAPSGALEVSSETNSATPRPLVNDISKYTAFVDGDNSFNSGDTGTDVVVSEVETGNNDLSPGKATPVSLAPGQSMTVSFAVEIDKGVPSNGDVLNNMTVFAVNDDSEESTTISQGLTANATETGA